VFDRVTLGKKYMRCSEEFRIGLYRS
jgi:hypothetical protein